MKDILVVAFLSILIVCTSCKSYEVKQKGYLTENNKRVTYKLSAPKGYLKKDISQAHGKSYEFKYENDGLFYFSTEDFGWNYEEVRNAGKFVVGGPGRDEINSAEGFVNSGYWRKEEVKGIYLIGYQNISAERKDEFDSIINEFIYKYNGR